MATEPTIEEAKASLADYCRRMRASEDGIHDSAWPHAAAIETLLASHASLEERVEEAKRLIVWCRARLKSDAYRATLDRMQSDPVEADHTPVLAAFVNEKET